MDSSIQSCFERYEKKYLLTIAQQQFLLHEMQPHLQQDQYGAYTICNLYYDTEDYQLIRTSLEKPIYKEKLRVRSYGVPENGSTVFIELKKKFNGVVYKRRITTSVNLVTPFLKGTLPVDYYGQIGCEILWAQQHYHAAPKVFIGYDRLAFSGTDDPELRITFDSGLRWRNTELDLRLGDHGAFFMPQNQVLMEIKLPSACPLWLSRLLSDAGVFPTTFSKYGTCYRGQLLPKQQIQTKPEEYHCA